MDNQELLIRVKRTNDIKDGYDDDTILEIIDQVKRDLVRMGVKKEVVNSPDSIGIIAQGYWEKRNLKQYTQDFKEQVISLREMG